MQRAGHRSHDRRAGPPDRVERPSGCWSSPTRNPFIAGVVGWVDLQADDVEARVERAAAEPEAGRRAPRRPERAGRPLPAEAGVRPRRSRRWRGIGLVYDILIYPRHLPVAVGLRRAFRQPDVRARSPREAGHPQPGDRRLGARPPPRSRSIRTSGASCRASSPRRTGSAGRPGISSRISTSRSTASARHG